MRYIVVLILLNSSIFPFEFLDKYKAQQAYANREYQKALEYLNKLPIDDELLLKKANIYYRLKEYKKALSLYKQIRSPAYNFIKLYNMANSFMNLQEYQKAIIFYQEALKFANDTKAKHNLSLAKKYYKKELDTINEKKKDPQSSQKAQGLCKLFSGNNPLFLDDDNTTFYGTLAKYKNLFQLQNNIATKQRMQKSIRVEISDTKREKNNTKVLKKDDFTDILERNWDKKLQKVSDETLLIPIKREEK